MNFKVFAKFVMWLGGLIVLSGFIYFANNQPMKFDRSKSKMNPWGGRNDMGNFLETRTANLYRTANRNEATVIMVAGAIVLFIGFGVSASSKTK